MRIFYKLKWRKGGELIAFAIVIPMIMFVFCALIMASQLGIARQSIEYTVYSAARAAVICENQNQAQAAAELILDEMIDDIPGIDKESAKVTIQNYMGTMWQKGGLIKCTVTARINNITFWRDSVVTADITMMIERPAALSSLS